MEFSPCPLVHLLHIPFIFQSLVWMPSHASWQNPFSLISIQLEAWQQLYCVIYHDLAVIS